MNYTYLASTPVIGVATCFFFAGTAHAGQLTAQGNVNALTDFNQMGALTGTAAFDEGPVNQDVPLNQYAAQGLTWATGDFAAILPGIMSTGTANAPFYQSDAQYFPQPIKNGGVQVMNYVFFGGVATFNIDITQVGMTAGRNGNQFLTAWNKQGGLIGQVNWVPANDASFIGIDTKGVPIGMIAYGNDDVFNGVPYNVGGSTIMADTWVWSKGACANDAACDDKDTCNGAETCMAGKCLPGAPLECIDDNGCTDNSCDKLLGCVFTDNVAPCEDVDACTVDTVCADGVCGGGEALACEDDMDVCTAELCDPNQGCITDPIPGCCKDDAGCLPEESCDLDANVCVPDLPDTSTGGESTGGTTTGEGTTGEGTTGAATVTDGTTGEPTTAGTTTGEPGSTSGGTGTGGGEPLTTTNEPETTSTPTTGASAGDSTGPAESESDVATETTSIDDDSGCGCRSSGAGDALGTLASLGLGLLLRRRRRAA